VNVVPVASGGRQEQSSPPHRLAAMRRLAEMACRRAPHGRCRHKAAAEMRLMQRICAVLGASPKRVRPWRKPRPAARHRFSAAHIAAKARALRRDKIATSDE
jgi:hypothetical protein